MSFSKAWKNGTFGFQSLENLSGERVGGFVPAELVLELGEVGISADQRDTYHHTHLSFAET